MNRNMNQNMNHKAVEPPIKKQRRGIMDDTRIRLAIAIVAAMFTWLVVVIVVAPGSDMIIDNVPVNFAYETAQYTNLGYSVVTEPEEMTVSIKVTGDRTVIGSLKKEDFVVYPDYAAVVSSGETSLKLLVQSLDGNSSDFTVEFAPSSRSSVVMVFDTVETITLPITLRAGELYIEEGYVLVKTSSNPSEVSFTGPTGELEQIAEVVAEYSASESLAGNTALTATLRFLDQDGNDVEFTYASAEFTTIDVNLVINKYADIPITVSFINTPENFDESVLDYSFNHETLRVSGDAKVIDSMKEISVGIIDLSTFALDKVYEMAIELPDGIIQQDNINVITVSFDCSDMATKSLNISADNVVIENLPDNYQLSVVSSRIMNVTLCGPADVIESLSASSVIATIDADDFSIALGTQTISVSISVPSDGQVFAIGSYAVDCKIESN